MRVLIVDDEEFNRLRMRDLLESEPDVEVVGEASNGEEAVALIRRLHPDLVFLDIRMPGKSGLDVAREVGAATMPATVFVTAYDQYAVEAFDVAALDYLIKPFDDERFALSLSRARRMLALEGLADMRTRLLKVLEGPSPSGISGISEPSVGGGGSGSGSGSGSISATGVGVSGVSGFIGAPSVVGGEAGVEERAQSYWERIPVEEGGTIRPVDVGTIDYILASGPYAELVVAGRRYLVRETMQVLEERLDPGRFMRIHRSVIVRLDRVEGMRRGSGGDGEVLLKGGGRLRVSRTRREALERWLGLSA